MQSSGPKQLQSPSMEITVAKSVSDHIGHIWREVESHIPVRSICCKNIQCNKKILIELVAICPALSSKCKDPYMWQLNSLLAKMIWMWTHAVFF